MTQCLELGGVTTEMAIQDNSEAITALIITLTAQGVTNQELLIVTQCLTEDTNKELILLNARTEAAYDTMIIHEDIDHDTT